MSALDKSRFVDVSDKELDEFMCSICQDIFVEPVVTQCCRQIFCKQCIYQWLERSSVCPNDRKPLTIEELTTPPRLVINLLNNMKVKCDYHLNGCQMIVTIEELSKHIQFCEQNPNRVCKTCGLKMEDREHNCMANLMASNSRITTDIQKLIKENEELKAKLKKVNNAGITSKNMEATIQSARNCINNVVVSQITEMTVEDQNKCIVISKHAITHCDSYETIANYLNYYWKKNDTSRQWYAVVFAENGGESSIYSSEFIQLRFDRLFIELFTSNRNNSHNLV